MDHDDAFLADVAADRDDDAPRLIYADWLDDHGDPDQARFIRAQCRLATLEPWEAEYFDLAAEADDLLARHRSAWVGSLGGVTSRVEFRRGFPHRVTLPGAEFAARAARAIVAAPTLSACRVSNAADGWDALLASPALEHFTALAVGGQRLGAERLQALARSPRVGNLRDLRLAGTSLRDAYPHLAASPHLARLERLDLAGCGLRDAGLAAFLGGTFGPNLRALRLDENGLTAAGLAALAASQRADRLEELSFAGWGDADLAQAFAAGDWRALRRLSFDFSRRGHDDLGLTADGVAALAGCRSLAGLRSLRLGTAARQSLAPLIESPHLAGLAELTLHGESRPRGLAALADAPMTPNLRALSLDFDPVDGVQKALLDPVTAGLVILELRGGTDTKVCHAETVAAAGHLTNLRRFVTHNTSLDRTVAALADAPHLANLHELEINWLSPGIGHAAELAENPYLNRLRSLKLSGYPPLPKKVMTALEKRFGKGVVRYSATP